MPCSKWMMKLSQQQNLKVQNSATSLSKKEVMAKRNERTHEWVHMILLCSSKHATHYRTSGLVRWRWLLPERWWPTIEIKRKADNFLSTPGHAGGPEGYYLTKLRPFLFMAGDEREREKLSIKKDYSVWLLILLCWKKVVVRFLKANVLL